MKVQAKKILKKKLFLQSRILDIDNLEQKHNQYNNFGSRIYLFYIRLLFVWSGDCVF